MSGLLGLGIEGLGLMVYLVHPKPFGFFAGLFLR